MNVINELYKKVADCIASFAVGLTINCCNNKCDNKITFLDNTDLIIIWMLMVREYINMQCGMLLKIGKSLYPTIN